MAKDVPGYSGNYTIDDKDAVEESRLIQEDYGIETSVESVDLCEQLDVELINFQPNHTNTNRNVRVTLESITEHNNLLVDNKNTNEEELRKLL